MGRIWLLTGDNAVSRGIPEDEEAAGYGPLRRFNALVLGGCRSNSPTLLRNLLITFEGRHDPRHLGIV